jgi:hypothetical protein
VRNPGTHHLGNCPTCGKHRFATRRGAKLAARYLHPEDNMRAYQCGPWWHYGNNSPQMKRGNTGRELTS